MNPFQGGGDMIKTVTFEKTTYAIRQTVSKQARRLSHRRSDSGAAIDYLNSIGREAAAAYEAELLRYATQKVSAIEGVRIIGTAKNKASVLSFVIDDIHPHDIGTILGSGRHRGSRRSSLRAAGMQRFKVPATARASFAFYNTKQEIDVLARTIERVIEIFS
jgi:cysteine desulfurase/selenocysteine lyase